VTLLPVGGMGQRPSWLMQATSRASFQSLDERKVGMPAAPRQQQAGVQSCAHRLCCCLHALQYCAFSLCALLLQEREPRASAASSSGWTMAPFLRDSLATWGAARGRPGDCGGQLADSLAGCRVQLGDSLAGCRVQLGTAWQGAGVQLGTAWPGCRGATQGTAWQGAAYFFLFLPLEMAH